MAIHIPRGRYFALGISVFLVINAYFHARVVTSLLGATLLSEPRSASAPTPDGNAGQSARAARSGEGILARNAFDSITGPLVLAAPEAAVPSTPVESDPLLAPNCDGVTVSIVTESRDVLWSVAALRDGLDGRSVMRRVGDAIGGKRISFIGFNPRDDSPAVWLTQGNLLCQVTLFASTRSSAPTTASTVPLAPSSSKLPADVRAKIQKLRANEFRVDRSLLSRILENPAELMASVRILPQKKGEGPGGLRLLGVRPDTLLGMLGLQNGDRLEKINGFSMANAEQAMEAYVRLRAANELTVQLSRSGAPVVIQVHID